MPEKKSYDFDSFTLAQSSAELERLQKQAEMVADIEIPRLNTLGLDQSSRILDMGCGPGFITAKIAEQCSDSIVLGIDKSRDLLDVARKIIAPRHSNLSFRQGDVYQTDLEDNKFDFVYSRFIFQHLDKPQEALKEINRISKPGGRVCIADIDDSLLLIHPELPGLEPLKEMAHMAKLEMAGDRYIGRKLAGLMEKAGFKNIKVRMECLSSLDIGWEAFYGISVGFRYHYAKTSRDKAIINNLESELATLSSNPFGMAGIVIAVGEVDA